MIVSKQRLGYNKDNRYKEDTHMEYQIMVDGIEIQSNERVNEKEARAYICLLYTSRCV